MRKFNHLLIAKVSDADLRTKMGNYPTFSPNIQEGITVGDMVEFHKEESDK